MIQKQKRFMRSNDRDIEKHLLEIIEIIKP